MQITRQGYDQYSSWVTGVGTLDADYSYDQAGHVLTYARPGDTFGATGPVTYTYSFDTMGRPTSLTDNDSTYGPGGHNTTWAQNALYDLAGRRTSMSYLSSALPYYNTESWSYNVNGQLATLNWAGGSVGINGSLQYSYSATQNNGQISQVVDSVSGETIVYQYDLLRRLTSASSTPNYGSSPTPWTQTFQYDGFENLTAKVLNGTTTPIAVNAATNQLTSGYYDANGNMTSGLGATMTYDEANRTASAAETSGGTEYYGYAPDNKRIYRRLASGSEEWTLYGAYGEKLGVYSMVGPTTGSSSTYSFTPLRTSVWFTGMLIWEGAAAVYRDAVGTNRAGGARFYPYGDEITSTSNDRSKFGTYNRDSFTGFDYADQRYYASTYGRFNTADPYRASGGSSDPGSWNRYSYVEGDPINHLDRQGLCTEDLNGDWWDSDFGYELWLQYADQALYSDQGSCANDGTFLAAVAAAGGATLNGGFFMAQATPPPPPPPLPQCDIEFGYVPALSTYLPGQHTFFFVDDPSGWNVVDAGPVNPIPVTLVPTPPISRGRLFIPLPPTRCGPALGISSQQCRQRVSTVKTKTRPVYVPSTRLNPAHL